MCAISPKALRAYKVFRVSRGRRGYKALKGTLESVAFRESGAFRVSGANRARMDELDHKVDIALLQAAVDELRRDMEETEKRFEKYVEQAVFVAFRDLTDLRLRPLERLMTGLVGLVLATVLTAVLALVVRGVL